MKRKKGDYGGHPGGDVAAGAEGTRSQRGDRVELARRGSVTVNNQSVVRSAGIAAKRKAALVVAALLRACVPDEVRRRADVQDVIRGVIGAYL